MSVEVEHDGFLVMYAQYKNVRLIPSASPKVYLLQADVLNRKGLKERISKYQ